ncbi:hypothetical protein PI125_g9661 [Phytophthora idaei]|nr:hypothetical protein PI125_g9661 [Phytophthora idaei]
MRAPLDPREERCQGRQPEVGKDCHGSHWDGRLTGLYGGVVRYAGDGAELVASMVPLQIPSVVIFGSSHPSEMTGAQEPLRRPWMAETVDTSDSGAPTHVKADRMSP